MLTSPIAFYHFYISMQTCYALKLVMLIERATLVEATREKLVEGTMAVRSAPIQTINLKLRAYPKTGFWPRTQAALDRFSDKLLVMNEPNEFLISYLLFLLQYPFY